MKLKPNKYCSGLTLMEALIVVVVLLALLTALLLPTLRPYPRAYRINCVNNLKQVGFAFRQWALDNNDRYPMRVSITSTNGGAMEWAEQGIAWPIFQVMSNELNTPKVLVCPADTSRTNAADFNRNLNNWGLSYFVGLDANETQPQMILTGDSDLEINNKQIPSGILELGTNQLVGWSAKRHKVQGNVGLADGSVLGYSSTRFRQALTNTGDLTNRIIIP